MASCPLSGSYISYSYPLRNYSLLHCSYHFISCSLLLQSLWGMRLAPTLFHYNLSCHIFCTMHFDLERAARVTEVGAPFPPITQEVTHRQPIPCSNPEMLLPCDSQIALITERRSMPFRHQSTSKTSTKSQSSNDASTIQRPASPAPTLSSRRSVSSMKELLPLRLQEIPPKIDLASWLDCTAPDMRNPVLPSLEHKEPAAYSLVPWMSSSQDMRISCDLPPNRYRETPIYTGSGSPMLSQAYFSDEELCYSCSPRGSVCDELCIVTDYEDAEVSLPYSHECPVDRADTIEDGRNGSIETSTTSFASTRFSTLSAGCHEEYFTPGEATWMKSGLRSWTSGQTEEVPYGDGNLVVREDQSSFEGWLNSESSRSSSSFSSDEVLDVCTIFSNSAFSRPVLNCMLTMQ